MLADGSFVLADGLGGALLVETRGRTTEEIVEASIQAANIEALTAFSAAETFRTLAMNLGFPLPLRNLADYALDDLRLLATSFRAIALRYETASDYEESVHDESASRMFHFVSALLGDAPEW
jgi:hypothetical protein